MRVALTQKSVSLHIHNEDQLVLLHIDVLSNEDVLLSEFRALLLLYGVHEVLLHFSDVEQGCQPGYWRFVKPKQKEGITDLIVFRSHVVLDTFITSLADGLERLVHQGSNVLEVTLPEE